MNATMKWKCITCLAKFDGPIDHKPKDGCPECGSASVFDINIEPLSIDQAAAMGLQIVPLQYLLRHHS